MKIHNNPRFKSRFGAAGAAIVSVIGLQSGLMAEDSALTRSVTGQQSASGAQIILNQVDTSEYPKVTVFATVVKDGRPMKGLGPADFRVREDEVEQEPLTVAPKLTPLNAVVTLDTSGSMSKRMNDAKMAAKGFVDSLNSEDSVQVLSFARTVSLLNPGTASPAAAKAAIDGTVARGDTALFDALFASVNTLKDRPGRKAIALLSDGADDNGAGGQLSTHSLDDVLALAKEVNVPIYTIGVGTNIDTAVLARAASETGGEFLPAPEASQLSAMYARLSEQLSGQYTIHYTSNLPADGAEHRIQLAHGDAVGRKVFMAPKSTSTTATSAAAKAPVGGKMDLLSPKNGGELVAAPGEHWAMLTDGVEDKYFDMGAGHGMEAVYGFNDGQVATFDRFEILIPSTNNYNAKDIELLASNHPTEGFESIATISTKNIRLIATKGWQSFSIEPTTAKYFMMRPLHGHQYNFHNLLYEIRLVGEVGKTGGKVPAVTEAAPLPGPTEAMDLISPENGGALVSAPGDVWAILTDGKVDQHIDVAAGGGVEAVYSFRNGEAKAFDRFEILIPSTANYNARDIELFASDDPIEGFKTVATISTKNTRLIGTGGWQSFRFDPVKAKYFKMRPVHGHQYNFHNLYYEVRLRGDSAGTAATSPSAAPAPAPVETAGVDLIAPANGGMLVAAPGDNWAILTDGVEDQHIDVAAGQSVEAVFGFNNGEKKTFDRFEFLVPSTNNYNARDIELLASDEPTEGFKTIATISTENQRMIATKGWQSFSFEPTTAKYFMMRPVHGHQYNFHNLLYEIRLIESAGGAVATR